MQFAQCAHFRRRLNKFGKIWVEQSAVVLKLYVSSLIITLHGYHERTPRALRSAEHCAYRGENPTSFSATPSKPPLWFLQTARQVGQDVPSFRLAGGYDGCDSTIAADLKYT